jgi:ABC-type lipoprotein export system ATPase subunit/ABC-type transporter Mla maintaining outer membrane lipid asymmetry permease subunit MlaE
VNPAPALALEGFSLGHRAGGRERMLVRGVDLEVPSGRLFVLSGPSGSGKTTLAHVLLGLEDPFDRDHLRRGTLRVLGRRVAASFPRALRGRVGGVLQNEGLLDDRSPRANVRLALVWASGPLRRRQAGELLADVGLADPPARISDLSGGQRKRVALARALASDPELFVLDEPTAGLDAAGARDVIELIASTHRASGGRRTTLVITHDERFLPVCDGIIWLDPEAGTLRLVPAQEGILHAGGVALARGVGPLPPVRAGGPAAFVAGVVGPVLLRAARMGGLIVSLPPRLIPLHGAEVLRAVREATLRPALFVAIGTAMIGGLSAYFAIRSNPLSGAFDRPVLTGTGKALVSVLIPLLAAFFFAARFAAGAAARIGSMRRTAQFEALAILGISPTAFLLTPLVWGAVIGLLVLTAVGIVSALLAAVLAARFETGLSPPAILLALFGEVGAADLRHVLWKAAGGGVLLAWTSYLLASAPKPSASAVGEAVNGAIVWGVLAVLALHALLTWLQFR